MKILDSKKATVTTAGATGILAAAPFVAWLIKLALPEAPDEAIMEFTKFALGLIGAVLASYNLAQGYADGKSSKT